MPIDFHKLVLPKPTPQPIDPIELFQSLPVEDPAINDLWLAQGDALRQWNQRRDEHDIAIVLNTGAGKTLVGLLAAQSLANEAHGHVVYACSSIQLVQQTASKARGYGLHVSTYTRGNFSNTHYRQAIAPCITTYHALFNGRSIFFADPPDAVVFDDAHTAGHLLRDQFTLRIRRDALPETFGQLVQLFRLYFTRIGKDMGYMETQDQVEATTWFVPPFAVRSRLADLQQILREASLGTTTETMFAWEYLRDFLDLCAVFVSGNEIAFTPAVIPTNTLPYFGRNVRRLYLSATLAAKDAFLRAFGREPDVVITPTTTAGECERLILIPSLNKAVDQSQSDITSAKRIIDNHKSLVLVPSKRRAQVWSDMATNFAGTVDEQVDAFRETKTPSCLVLTARYDGIDLPGDTCRLLVIDDLPTGLNPLERYLYEQLKLFKLLRSTTASRVVQSFGRISRGMSDHGVVVLTSSRLIDWLLIPRNQALLPEFLRRQLQLGIDLSQRIDDVESLIDATQKCLSRDDGWTEYYRHWMEETKTTESVLGNDEILTATRAEVAFGLAIWERQYSNAAKALEQNLEETFKASRSTGAWHALWLGYCYDLLGDPNRAQELYARAHRVEKHIPPFDAKGDVPELEKYPSQVHIVAASLQRGDHPHLVFPTHFDRELTALDGSGSVRQVEAAIEALGEYLGLDAQRPDNELGTGPDIIWATPEGSALSMEAKTGKSPGTLYRKEDLGQLRDHRQWVQENLNPIEIHSAFVGPVVPASPDANPDDEMLVIETGVLRDLRDRLRAALNDVVNNAVPAAALPTVYEIFTERRLLWPAVYDDLPKHILRDVR